MKLNFTIDDIPHVSLNICRCPEQRKYSLCYLQTSVTFNEVTLLFLKMISTGGRLRSNNSSSSLSRLVTKGDMSSSWYSSLRTCKCSENRLITCGILSHCTVAYILLLHFAVSLVILQLAQF